MFITIPNVISLEAGNPGGTASDVATAGNTQQSFFVSLLEFDEVDSASASATDPAIPPSILKNYRLHDIPLSVLFSLSGLQLNGSLTFGDLVVSDTLVPTPIPGTLPLFGSILSDFWLWRQRIRFRVVRSIGALAR